MSYKERKFFGCRSEDYPPYEPFGQFLYSLIALHRLVPNLSVRTPIGRLSILADDKEHARGGGNRFISFAVARLHLSTH